MTPIFARRLLAVALLCVTAGLACSKATRTHSHASVACSGTLSPEDLYRLQVRIQRGENVCPELANPSIEVSSGAVHLNGQRLNAALPRSSVEQIDPLFQGLRSARELWKTLRPGQEFDPTAAINVAPDIDAVAGASVLRTAALAGFPKIALRAGDVNLRFEYALPLRERPPEDRGAVRSGGDPLRTPMEFGEIRAWEGEPEERPVPPPPPPKETLRISLRDHGQVRLRFSGRVTPRLGLDQTVPQAEVEGFLDGECRPTPKACADRVIVELGRMSFHDAAKLARVATRHASPGTSIGFEERADEGDAGRAKGVGSADSGTAQGPKLPKHAVRVLAASISGPIAQEAVQGILRRNEGRLRECYEAGLVRNPQLLGRVSVRFVIGRDGRVYSVANGGSDVADRGVVSCVLRVHAELQFPPPRGNVATVVSPSYLMLP